MTSTDAAADDAGANDGLIAYWSFDDVGSQTVIDHGPGGFHGTVEHGAGQVAGGRIGGAYDYGGTFGDTLLTGNPEFDDGLDGWLLTGGGSSTTSLPVVGGSTVLAISDIVPGEFQTPQLEASLTMEPETRYLWRLAGRCEQDKTIVLLFYDVDEALAIASEDWACKPWWTDGRVYFENDSDPRTTRVYAKVGSDTTPVLFDNATIYLDDLPGPQPRMTVDAAPSLAGQAAASWCAWVYFENGLAREDDGRIISNALGTDIRNANWELLAQSMNKWALRLRTGSDDGVQYVADVIIPTETWTHVCATYSAEDELVVLYQDGDVVGADPHSGTIADDTAGVFEIGNNGHSPSTRMFPGLIDDVRIYNRALAPGEVIELMAAGGQ